VLFQKFKKMDLFLKLFEDMDWPSRFFNSKSGAELPILSSSLPPVHPVKLRITAVKARIRIIPEALCIPVNNILLPVSN
jgi:hypothetical protein